MASKRLQALAQAHRYVGVKEYPAGSNRGPQIDKWNRRAVGVVGVPWCMSFVHCMFEDVGVVLGGHALVQAFVTWADHQGELVARPLKGDLVCYDWNGDRWADHVGFVDKVLALRWRGRAFAGWIRTVEGNTAVGNDSNGGQVMVRRRWVGSCKFVRIPG